MSTMIRCRYIATLNGFFLNIFYILIALYWQLSGRSTTGYYLNHGKIGKQRLSNIWPELKVPNAYSGQLYQTNIASSNLRDYDIRFLVSKVGSQDLPTWLKYENGNYSLTGIPLASDVGLHQLFVLAMRCNETTSNTELLGVQTFEIMVVSSENRSYCDKGVNFTAIEVFLAVNGTQLNSTQRIELFQSFVTEFDLSDRTSSIYFKHKFESENSNHTGCEVLQRFQANTSYVGPVLSISWLVGCDLNVSLANTSDKISAKLSEAILDYPVFSWRILNGNDSTLCLLDVHKSTVVSSVYLDIHKSTGASSIHPSMVVKASSLSAQMALTSTTPMSVFGNTTIDSSGIYFTSAHILSFTLTEQEVLHPTASYLSNSVIPSTRPPGNFSSVVLTTVQQLYLSSINQSSLMLVKPTTLMTPINSTQEANNPSFVFRENSTSTNATSLNPSFRPTFSTSSPNSTNLFQGMSGFTGVYNMSMSTRTSVAHMAIVSLTLHSVHGQHSTSRARSELISPTKSGIVPTITQSTTPTQNSDPVVRHPLPTLNISSCQYLYYEIPEDTFWDREDGNTLTLRLLTKSFRELSTDSWVNFDPTRDIIYGVPVSSQIFGKNSTRVDLEYTLSAVDSSGRDVNTSLALTVYDDAAPAGQQISIEVDSQTVSFNPLQLVQDVSEYLYNGDKTTMKILSLNQTSTKIYLTWGDCKAVLDVCDVRRVERTSKLIRIDENFLNPHFVIALVPDFVLLDARVEKLGMCLNEPPVARKESIHLNITCCGKFRYDIPRDLFYDQEDGDTRNLSLSIRYTSASRLLSETWVMLNDTSKTLEGVVIFEQAQKYPDFQEFFIVAKDSGRIEVNVSVVITVQHPLPVSNYFVSLFLKRFHSFSTPLQEVFTIIEKLDSYFDGEPSDEIRVLSYSRENTITVFTWSMAGLRLKPCDSAAIANISQKLKGADGQVNDGFELIMMPEFEVQFIFEERLRHCKEGANEQPSVLIPVHQLRLNLTYFEYIIPARTFNDLEDGNTRNLKLSLLLPSFEPLPLGSWIVLDSETQVIYGLPDEDTIQVQPTGGYRYLLVGQDSGGKVASSSVLVQLPETTQPYNYHITAHLRSYLDASLPCVDHVVEFLGKLSTFLGEDKDHIRVVSYNISKTYPADVTISWTNRSASFNTCDHEMIRNRFKKFTNHEIGVTKSFSEVLLPYFIVQDIKLEFLETCDVFSNTPPVLLLPVKTLKIPLYQVLRFQLPVKMFYDAEDGYTRNLTVAVLDQDYKPLNSSSWIQFNASTQLLYGLPTSTVAKQQPTDGYVINIVAMDTHSNMVNSTTRIVINNTHMTVNYKVEISMAVNTSLEYSDSDLVLKFLAKVEAFLGNSNTIVTDYFKGNTTLNVWISTLNFRGIECNFVELQEIRHHLLFQIVENTSKVVMGNRNATEPADTAQPNGNFTRVMQPDFLISSVTEHKTGSCSNTAPVLLQPIPYFVISTHGLFSIALPSKTFYDLEDGFISNLSLSLLSSTGQVLPPNSWLQFNETTDELYGVVIEEIRLNKNYTFVLKAEDSYGLKTNTSFTIEVTSRFQNVGLKLNMIFKSNFSSIVPHVDIIKLLLARITSYYNGNITLNVLSYERGSGIPSTDIISWSVPELDSENCDLQHLDEISKKARYSTNQPSEEFKRALLPEFELLAVFEQRLGSCADTLNSLPRVIVSILNLNITRIPTVFYYEVPRNVFDDAEDGDTRNLTLTLVGVDNKEILRNSSVQLNQPLQMLYGVFTKSDLDTASRVVKRDLSSSTRVMRFILLAMDSGGKTASSSLEIYLGNDIISQNVELHLTFISYLSSTSPDVRHLINFQEKLRGFEALRDMQVANYLRSSGYPAKFEVSFINSSSNINQSFCDFSEISSITETFQDSSRNLGSEFTTSFLPEFVVQESYIQRLGPCQNFPNNPPRVNMVISIINITLCEMLKFQIPENAFLDEDGNTRNLSLNLENVLPQQQNLDWIFFDDFSQIIYAVPSLEVVANQSNRGYVFKLTATDSHGESAALDLTVLVRDTIRDSYRLTVVARVPSMIITKEDLVLKTIKFVEATKHYLSGQSTNEIRVIEFAKISQSLLKVAWSSCSLRYTPCDYRNIEEIRQATINTGTLPQPRFIQSLAPAFIVDSVEDEMRGPCLNQRPAAMRTLEPLNASLCDGLLQYSIPYNTFLDKEDGYTQNLTLSLLSSTSIPLSDTYWLTIDQSQTIVAYPNVDALKAQPESGYEFRLNAKDSYGLSTNLAMKVLYEGDIPQSTYEVTLVLQAKFANMTRSVDQMRIILQTLAGYMGGSEKSIRIHSFLRAGVNSTTSFFTWSNCSFDLNGCDLLGIVEISKRLRNTNGQISEQLREAFRPKFELQFVFEQRLGACVDDTNVRPKVKQAFYKLTVENFCGFLQFQIPPDFFYDAEDGGTRNLTLSLKTIDSMEINSDSWIQLNQESQTLYGFPSLNNSSNSSTPTRELFILIAADSQGKLATMRLEIIFGKKIPNVHYGVLVEMSSYVGESRADVYHLKYFVERLALFLKAETGSIMVTKYSRKTSGTSSRLSVTWTNCSVAVNSCDSNQINIIREKLNLVRGEVDRAFSQSMLPYFVPNFITLKKFGLCTIEAMKSPPRLLRPIGRIFAYSGSLLRYSLPKDIFVDDEDGNALNLSLVLQFSNKVPVAASYWLKFDNTSLVISGVLLVENSWENSFRLVARDQHGNEAVDTFEVFLERRCPGNLLSYQVFSEVVYAGNEESRNQRFIRKLEVYFQPWFTDTNFTLLSTTAEANNTFRIVWSHAKTCGACFKVNATIQSLSENITDKNGTALPEFKTALLPEFILVNISEAKCSPMPGVPITVIKGGEEDRWKLYVVPIVVLLIFLLFSFIFFICRGFVFPYESKKEKVILAESPASEIHVNERIRPSEASMYNSASTTIINEGFLGNNDVIDLPEIFLDKRVSPSKSTLPQDLSPVSAQNVELVSTQDIKPAVVLTPPLYSDAVLLLAAESGWKPGERQPASPAIEMREIPIIKREVVLPSEAIPISEKSEVDGRRTPREERIHASRNPSLHSKPNDTWGTFDDEDDPIPLRNRLRLPTPPEVGMLRLPPVPTPLNNTPASSLGNSPASPVGNTPNSPPSSAYSTPLQTPSYSQTTVNNTYNVRHIRTPPEIPAASPNNYPNPPVYSEYPYGTPMRERTELGIQSPISYGTPIRERTQLGIQSPLGFPFPQGRVPYVDHRQQGPPLEPRSNDLHEVLGQLRETVNRELDRRNDVDRYLDSYLNRK